MSSDEYPYPVAVSQVDAQDSRESQAARAVKWLLDQPGGPILVVTPQKRFDGDAIRGLIARPATEHLTWRGLSAASLAHHRVLYAWPDRKHLNDTFGVEADALVVLEWRADETADWIEDAEPTRLLRGHTVQSVPEPQAETVPLPHDVSQILEHLAAWAAGYSSGLKWNEEDKLKADMMNNPQRWASVTVEQVRAKCRELKMRPNDIDTIAGFLQRRKDGRRFNVRGSYRDFRFE